MAYTDFDPAAPDPSTDSPGTCFDETLANLLAMRDSIVGGTGFFPGWNMAAYDASNTTPPASDADEPAYLVFTKGSDKVKVTITWGTSGVTDGWPTRLVASWWNGSSYDVIKGGSTNGYYDITYDANGNVTSAAWS